MALVNNMDAIAASAGVGAMAPRPGWCRSSRCATASGGCAADRRRSGRFTSAPSPTRRAVRRAGGGGRRDVGVTRRAGSGRRFRGRFPRRVCAGRALGIGAFDVVGDFRRETRGGGVRGSERGAHDRELRPEHGGVRADVRRRGGGAGGGGGCRFGSIDGELDRPPGGGDSSVDACVGADCFSAAMGVCAAFALAATVPCAVVSARTRHVYAYHRRRILASAERAVVYS